MKFRIGNLNNKTIDEIVALVTELPPTATSLDLRWNSLGKRPSAEIVAILRAIPANISSLDLGGNDLGSMTKAELIAIFAAIPPSISALDLRRSNLSKKTGAELVALVAVLPPTVSSLDLGGNDLYNKTADELVALFAATPPSLSHLGLSNNYLASTKSGDELVAALAAIPATLKSLDLSGSELYQLTRSELTAVVAATPPSLHSLNLSGNDLGFKAGAVKLGSIFAVLPATLSSLNLSGNRICDEQLDAILSTIPSSIESIIFKEEAININKHCVEQLLMDVVKRIEQQGMNCFVFNKLTPTIKIDGKRLNRLIEVLEKLKLPFANLSCGLLLEGKIETTTNILRNYSEYEQHFEKRTHDAISFYSKAAEDPSIKPMVEGLLRNIKMNCPSTSVQNRLAFYDLAPQDNLNGEPNQALKNQLAVVAPLLGSFGVFNRSSAEPDGLHLRSTFGF